jgi:hypothetical protein
MSVALFDIHRRGASRVRRSLSFKETQMRKADELKLAPSQREIRARGQVATLLLNSIT